LDRPVGQRIVERIRWLAENQEAIGRAPLADDLTGLYKLRVGDYRVLYEILHGEQTIVIHAIGHRRDIFRTR
jgi:mRNA interferase RelE/StbE